MNHIIAIGFVLAVLAAAILLRGRLRNDGDAALAALMCVIAVHFGIKFSIYTVIADEAVRHQMNTCVGFCYGPLLVLFSDQLRGRRPGLQRWYLYLPFAAALVGYLTVIAVLTVSAEIGHVVLQRYNACTWFLIPLVNGACSLAAWRSRVHCGRDGRPLVDGLSLLLLAGCMVPTLMSLSQLLFPALHELPIRTAAYLIIAAMPAFLIWNRSSPERRSLPPDFRANARPVVINASDAEMLDSEIVCDVTVKPETVKVFTIDERAAHATLLENVEQYLASGNALSDPELSLERLAGSVGVSRHQLSEMLNAFAGERFYDFLNRRRIHWITAKMEELHRLGLPVNVLILAYDGGFKAKSSFNAAFKKFTRTTPTAYLEGLRAAGTTVQA